MPDDSRGSPSFENTAALRPRGPSLETGREIGRSRVVGYLGRGGMGEVYEGVHVEAGTRAAVKLVRGDRLGDPEVVESFLQETEVAQRVRSPHVARVYEAGGLE